jgi:hypothetical protein
MAEPDNRLGFDDENLNKIQNTLSEEGKARYGKANTPGKTSEEVKPLSPSPERTTASIKNLRTFQGDIAEAIKNQNASVLSIAMAEQARTGRPATTKVEKVSSPTSFVERIIGKRQEKKQVTPPRPFAEAVPIKPAPEAKEVPRRTPVAPTTYKAPPPIPQVVSTPPPIPIPTPATPIPQTIPQTNRIVMSPGKAEAKKEFAKNAMTIAVSILLIVLGISAVVGFYFIQKRGAQTIVEGPTERALLSYQTREIIPITGQSANQIVQTLTSLRREKTLPTNDVLYIAFIDQFEDEVLPISTTRLFSLLRTQAPASLLRAMENEFMFGMYSIEGNQPFLLVPLSSFENGFDGMLRWEKTMNQDIGQIFSSRTVPITEYIPTSDTTSTPATTTTRLVYIDSEANAEFEDITIRNKDARLLKNSRGDTLILYSFLDQNTLLITSGEEAFQEILNKFLREKLTR